MKTERTLAVVVGSAPVLMTAALLWHPPIPGRLPDTAAIADHVAHDPTRWGLAHVAAAVASAVLILAFVAIRARLREAGDQRLSAAGLGLVVVAGTAYAMLAGMEFAALAAHEIGADPSAAQSVINPWFVAVLMTGGLSFALGMLGFAAAIRRTAVLGSRLTAVVVVAFVVLAVSRSVPIGVVQFGVQSAAALMALVPIAWAMWTARM
ncbi:hypothetical protein [Nocardia sp. NPDC058480]|uniref:hypothetical protein n=1 Tax=unclassified Nocardia TaxID=2637762 RepID=UPI0036468D50